MVQKGKDIIKEMSENVCAVSVGKGREKRREEKRREEKREDEDTEREK